MKIYRGTRVDWHITHCWGFGIPPGPILGIPTWSYRSQEGVRWTGGCFNIEDILGPRFVSTAAFPLGGYPLGGYGYGNSADVCGSFGTCSGICFGARAIAAIPRASLWKLRCGCQKVCPTATMTRKLACRASWSPSCFSEVLGGLDDRMKLHSYLHPPHPALTWLLHKQFGRGDTIGMSPLAAKPAASASSAFSIIGVVNSWHASSHLCSLAHYWHVHGKRLALKCSFIFILNLQM